MRTPQEIREWLRLNLAELDLTVAELAKLSGVNKATVHRALSGDYQYVPSTRTLDKLSEALLKSAERKGKLFQEINRKLSQTLLPVSILLGAGTVNEYWGRDNWGWSPLAVNPTIRGELQTCGRMADNSADQFYQPGDYIHLLHPLVLTTLSLKVGDHIVVARDELNDDIEFRLFEVAAVDGDFLETRSLAKAPELRREDRLRSTGITRILHEELSIAYLVAGFYRSRHFLTG